jgi:hypothetical protein
MFGCSPSQVRAQYGKNADQLLAMHQQAKRTGKPVNGFTASELLARHQNALNKSIS